MDITFLEASSGVRLSKHYADGKFTPYPNAFKVTSHKESVHDIDSLHDAITHHAPLGHCMMKNNFKRALVNEPRRGMGDKFAETQLLVLDFDKFPIPSVNTDLKGAVEIALTYLQPYGLNNIDYVAQASSSFKLKGNRMSFHVFFLLTEPVEPRRLKVWLQHVNLETDELRRNATLSENGHSVSYALDQSVADNSKMIYIAPPTFKDPEDNPFDDDADRIIKVTGKPYRSFDLTDYVAESKPVVVYEEAKKLKQELRAAKGLPKGKTSVVTRSIGDENLEVLQNPDKMHLRIVNEAGLPYVRCNVGDGDSQAYWFDVFKPEYMFNFKDEPIFSMQDVDPDFYQMILTRYKNYIENQIHKGHRQLADALRPMSFRDVYTDTFFAALYDLATNTFTDMNVINKNNLEGFYATWQKPEPSFHPDAEVKFEPSSQEPAINVSNLPYQINLWRPSDIMENEQEWDGDELYIGTASLIQEKCPTIYCVMHHMLGNGNAEFERMMNWLAFIYQNRAKAETAWILSGVQGTGKGVFANKVLKPLFGDKFTPVRTLENMEEQFNDYMRQAIICVVDEFHMPGQKSALTKMANKLKNMITEPSITIRAMRSNQVELPSFTSFIFNSNHADAVAIEASDRRYNVAPPQNTPLNVAHPDIDRRVENIEAELPYFAGALSAFDVNARLVRLPIMNEAKSNMIVAGQSISEEFVSAVKDGRLEYFNPILDMSISGINDGQMIGPAQAIVKKWMNNVDSELSVKQEELRIIYNVLTQDNQSSVKFGKMLQKAGVNTNKTRIGQSSARSLKIRWVLDEVTLQHWKNEYLSDYEKKHLQLPGNISDANES